MTGTMDRHEPHLPWVLSSLDLPSRCLITPRGQREQKGNLPDLQVARGAPQSFHPRPAPPVDTTEPALGKGHCGSY